MLHFKFIYVFLNFKLLFFYHIVNLVLAFHYHIIKGFLLIFDAFQRLFGDLIIILNTSCFIFSFHFDRVEHVFVRFNIFLDDLHISVNSKKLLVQRIDSFNFLFDQLNLFVKGSNIILKLCDSCQTILCSF